MILTYFARELAESARGDRSSVTPTRNEALFERAQRVIPGGVNSPVRAFRSVGGTPYFVARAEGAHVWDVEGNRYIDFVQRYGAIILGHAHPRSSRRSGAPPATAPSYGAPTEREVLLAEAIAERVPVAREGAPGVERHRGDDDGHPPRPGRHRPRPHREVRRQLPRPQRRPARRRRQRRAPRPGRCRGSAGVHRRRGGRHVVAPVQRRARARRRRRLRDRRAGRRQHGPRPAGARLPRGAARRVRPRRRAADLRRGHHRLPGRRRAAPRSASACAPTSACFGKVIGGGLQRRRVRRPGRRHGRTSRRSAPCTRRARCRGTRWPPPPGSPCSSLLDDDGLRHARRDGPPSWPTALQAAFAGAGLPVAGPARRHAGRAVLRPTAGRSTTTRRRRHRQRRSTRAFFHAMLDRGVALAPGAYEVAVPRPGPRRRRRSTRTVEVGRPRRRARSARRGRRGSTASPG